mgnify:CR=1 FL=1
MQLQIGDRVWFEEEKFGYTIRTSNDRYLVCTKPFNLRKNTVMYTVVDLKNELRSTDGYVFSPYDYLSDEDCRALIEDLENGHHISKRNAIPLKIKKKQRHEGNR